MTCIRSCAWLSLLLLAAPGGCGNDPMGTEDSPDARLPQEAGPPDAASDGGRDLVLSQPDAVGAMPDVAVSEEVGQDIGAGVAETGLRVDGAPDGAGEAANPGLDASLPKDVVEDVAQDNSADPDGSSVTGIGRFVATGSMARPRAYHTATRLPDGRVLVAGGIPQTYQPPSSTAELYHPSTGQFTATGSMQIARQGHTATLLGDGRVLMVGGVAGGASAVELYDPATERFASAGACTMSFKARFATTLLDDGKVLIAGAQASTSTDGSVCSAGAVLYDPDAESCICVGPLGTPPDETAAARLPDGKVLVIGYSWTAFAAAVYDPATRAFSPTGPSPYLVESATATSLANGKVLVVGYASSLEGSATHVGARVALLFDPLTRTFADLPINELRYHHTSTLLQDGRVLVAAGGAEGSASFTGTPTSAIFDPDAQTFIPVGWREARTLDGGDFESALVGDLMQVGRLNHTATLLPSGQVLLVGGESFYPVNLDGYESSAELFVPSHGGGD
jgi:hypothetical protein